jgi:hypothetical protein
VDYVLNTIENKLFPCSALRPDDIPLYLPQQTKLLIPNGNVNGVIFSGSALIACPLHS